MEEGEIGVQEDEDKDLIAQSEDGKPSPPAAPVNPEKEDEEDDKESSVLMEDDHFKKFYESTIKDDQPDPLGLKLQVTSQFLDTINTALSVEHKDKEKVHVASKGGSKPLKVGNFQAIELIIGSWKSVARSPNSLVVKVYYATRKLIWEIMYFRFKRKIEIQWNDILALNHYSQNGKEVLEVELSKPPTFFHEPETNPDLHPQWKPTEDFTGGQALICRRHKIVCPPASLSKELIRLFGHDNCLNELSKRGFPRKDSPYFDSSHKTKFPIVNSSGQFQTAFNEVAIPSLGRTQMPPIHNSALIQQPSIFPSRQSDLNRFIQSYEVPRNQYMGGWGTSFAENAQLRNNRADNLQLRQSFAYGAHQATMPPAFFGNNDYSHQATGIPSISGYEYLNNQIQMHPSEIANSAAPLIDRCNGGNPFFHQQASGTHGTYEEISGMGINQLLPARELNLRNNTLYAQNGMRLPQLIDQSMLLSDISQSNVPSHLFPVMSNGQNRDPDTRGPDSSDQSMLLSDISQSNVPSHLYPVMRNGQNRDPDTRGPESSDQSMLLSDISQSNVPSHLYPVMSNGQNRDPNTRGPASDDSNPGTYR